MARLALPSSSGRLPAVRPASVRAAINSRSAVGHLPGEIVSLFRPRIGVDPCHKGHFSGHDLFQARDIDFQVNIAQVAEDFGQAPSSGAGRSRHWRSAAVCKGIQGRRCRFEHSQQAAGVLKSWRRPGCIYLLNPGWNIAQRGRWR
jgi:hypothetical protein